MTAAPKIAVVGAGPAGCYVAQALRKELPEAEITVLDRLPAPYGLLRYGVAADHQGTKGVQQQFERLFARADVAFLGGAEMGRDFDLGGLRRIFDVVVLATGAPDDRRLGVSGEDLPGVVGSGALTRALNSHPEACAALPVLGRRIAIVGSGNVAVDLLRLLSRGPDEWEGSDMDEAILARVLPEPAEEIHLLARASADKARWDAAMIRELAGLKRPGFLLAGGAADLGGAHAATTLAAERPPTDGELTVVFHFETVIEAAFGDGRLEGARLRTVDGARRDLALDSLVTAIGFDWRPEPALGPGVYAAGWLRAGPQGAIPQQRAMAREVVAEILADLRSGAASVGRAGRRALDLEASGFEGWRRIDELERARAPEGRVRRKIADLAEMRRTAAPRGESEKAASQRGSSQ